MLSLFIIGKDLLHVSFAKRTMKLADSGGEKVFKLKKHRED